MDQYHLSSPHRTEAIRIFHIIQEFSLNPRGVLNAQSLLNFLQKIGLKNDEVIKFLHEIDKEGKEMNQQYWGLCISKYFEKVPLKSVSDLADFHTNFKVRICRDFFKPLMRYEQWDDNRLKTTEAKDSTFAQIIENWESISMFLHNMDAISIGNNIYKINRCFSLCTLFPEKTEYIISIFEGILKGNFLANLEYMLTMNIDDLVLVEILKTLCYLYQATKYDSVNHLLKQSFLLDPQTMKGLMRNLHDQRIQLKYYTCVMATLLVHQIPSFRQQIIRDNQFFVKCCQAIGNMKESQGLYYGLSFLIALVGEFSVLEQSFQNQNAGIISNIYQFAISSLQSCKETECQAACLNLIAECLKISTITEQQMKTLKIVAKVFDFQEDQLLQPLIAGALEIIKISLCYQRVTAQETLLQDKNFEHYLKKVLDVEHKSWQPMLSLLHICQIIASSHHAKILFQKDLIEVLFKMTKPQEESANNNGCILLYLSEIILKLIQSSLQSEWKLTYLYEKNLLPALGNLLAGSYKNDEIIQQSYPGISYDNNFCHKQVFTNCLYTLFLLSSETRGCSYQKKKELYVKEFSCDFVDKFEVAVRHFMKYPKNQAFTLFNLRQQHKISQQVNGQGPAAIKMTRLICSVIQEMTYCLRKRNTESDPAILRKVHHMRYFIYEFFYRFLNYQELESDSVPIYFSLIVTVEGGRRTIVSKYHRLNWSQFQSCLTEAIQNELMFEPGGYRIQEKNWERTINTELDYHKLMEWVLNNYLQSSFAVRVHLYDIQKRMEQEFVEERTLPIFGGGARNNQYGNSHRDSPSRNNDRFEVPRFMSTRLPEARGASPFNSYRGTERRYSPTFNSPCRKCSAQTSNRSGFCNNCARF